MTPWKNTDSVFDNIKELLALGVTMVLWLFFIESLFFSGNYWNIYKRKYLTSFLKNSQGGDMGKVAR